MVEEEKEEKSDEITIDFSKFFKRKKKEGDVSEPAKSVSEAELGEDVSIDFSSFLERFKGKKLLAIYAVLILILVFSAYLRFLPSDRYQGPFENSLSAMDPYWHYRHAEEIYENGLEGGNGFKMVDGERVQWDWLHDAPEGTTPVVEFYPAFTAYTYKYFAKAVYPSLLSWHRVTPAIFGVLAVLFMFFLVQQLFGPLAGLGAAFMYSLSAPVLTRTVVGFADSDAPIGFFTLLTFFLFMRAWDRESFIYAGIGGISLALFGFTWGGYTFLPLLVLGSVGLFFLYHMGRRVWKEKESILTTMRNHFHDRWRKYAVFIIFLAIGLVIIAIVKGPASANFLSAIHSTSLKVNPEVGLDARGPVRNVMLTVSEMSPTTPRQIFSQVHSVSILLIISFFVLLPLGLWKKMSKTFFHLVVFATWFLATFYMSLGATRFIEMLVIPMAIFFGIVIGDLVSRVDRKKPLVSIAVVVFLIAILFVIPNSSAGARGPTYYESAMGVAHGSGPSLGGNWLALFEWMRTETPEGAVMASWWDPGHAVTAIGERPAVADGSQNSRHVRDLALIFTGTNESEVAEIVDDYNISYFFTSADLIGKYGAISFLGLGQADSYPILGLSESRPSQDSQLLVYNAGQGTSILVTATNSTVSAVIRQGYTSQPIQRVFFFNAEGQGFVSESSDPTAQDVMLYVFPDFQRVMYLPPHLENNMLTQLHFFNGQNLENFELVKEFGGEIKVFKVKI